MVENLLRVQVLDKAPFATGDLQQRAILSGFVKKQYRKFFKMPAHQLLHSAFASNDIKLMQAMFKDVITEQDAKFVAGKARVWLGTALMDLGEKSLSEEEDQ